MFGNTWDGLMSAFVQDSLIYMVSSRSIIPKMVSLLIWPVAWTGMAGRGWLGDIIFS